MAGSTYRMIEQVDQAAPKAAPAPVNEGYLGRPTRETVGYIGSEAPAEIGGIATVFLWSGYAMWLIAFLYIVYKALGYFGKLANIGVLEDAGSQKGQGSFILTPIIALLWVMGGIVLVWFSGKL